MEAQPPNCFQILLKYLDSDEAAASGKYLNLHLKLTKNLIWNGCPESAADNLADETLDRVARKIIDLEEKTARGITEEKGREIKKIENINYYALEVNRFVWLEYRRKNIKPIVDVGGELPEIAVLPAEDSDESSDMRLRFLRKCIAEKIPDERDKQLILQYYKDDESDEKNKVKRKALAESLGITMINLKVKACRLRERLEKCINDCAAQATTVTDSRKFDTTDRGGN